MDRIVCTDGKSRWYKARTPVIKLDGDNDISGVRLDERQNEALTSEQVASRFVIGNFVSPYSANNELKPTVSAFGCNEDGPSVTSSPPDFGEHIDDILGEIGIPAEKIVGLRERGVV